MKLIVDRAVLYKLWLNRIVKSHVERSWDRPDEYASEAEDEWLHDHWMDLEETIRQRVCGLSADLHSLRDQEKLVLDGQQRTKQQLATQTELAFRRRDWDRLLTLLRTPPRFQPQAMVDYLRGRAWMELGEPSVALLFFDNAARLDPESLAYPSLALECLKSIPNWNEALVRAEKYRTSEHVAPRLLFRAGDIFHLWALFSRRPAYFETAIEVVDRGFSLLKQGSAAESLSSVVAGAFLTKTLSLEHLQRHEEALSTIDEAVSQRPDDAALLTQRGLLKQQLHRDGADEDFKAAIDRGTGLVWPYLELARIESIRKNFKEVAELSRQGLQRASSDQVAAQLFQLLGVALFELKDSTEAVRRAFDASLELDPLAEESHANRTNLNAYLQDNHLPVTWRVPSGDPLEAMAELREQLEHAA
ncbi:MAG: hypothetical protein C0483_10345 [Pirellula sp.]|nr:hypothetical protein [Pirellula sp.]